MTERTICAEFGRCAYDVVTGPTDNGCPYWSECFDNREKEAEQRREES